MLDRWLIRCLIASTLERIGNGILGGRRGRGYEFWLLDEWRRQLLREASDESGAVLSESHLDCASGVEDLLEVVGKVTDAGSGS